MLENLQTDCRLRYQYHCRKVPELSAHALLYPHFGQETYGIVTDIYALIPLALTLLTMGMESSYFRFSAKAEEAGGDVKAAKRRLFATTWGVTSLAAAVFFVVVAFFATGFRT